LKIWVWGLATLNGSEGFHLFFFITGLHLFMSLELEKTEFSTQLRDLNYCYELWWRDGQVTIKKRESFKNNSEREQLQLGFVCVLGGESLGKKEWSNGRNRGNGRGGFWGLTFLHNTKPSICGELKNCIGGGFIWILQI